MQKIVNLDFCCTSFRLSWMIVAVVGCFIWPALATAQLRLTQTNEMVLDSNALIMATGGGFGTLINGLPFQQEALITHGGFQYAAWYHNGANDEDIFLARRNLNGNVWETIDTGEGLENGDDTAASSGLRWDSHNIISMGISSDGKIHLAYDHHVHGLRYLTTNAGVAGNSAIAWNSSIFNAERNALNLGGTSIPTVTYPRFTNVGDDFVFTYRASGSGNGDVMIADYDSQTGQWSNTRFVNKGVVGNGVYNDVTGNFSDRRNAYHNGFHADSTGRLHTIWTWRERTQDGNHDIHYGYSDDTGVTWYNNDGVLVGTAASPVTLDSDTKIVDLDRRQALINQQGQIVDKDGGVHALMYHRRQEPGFEWEAGDGRFAVPEDSAYFHYYRDPVTAVWEVRQLPLRDGEFPGGRPRLGADGAGNVFAFYTQSNNLVILGLESTASGFADWKVLCRDERDFRGTPLLDNSRLFDEGILSVFLQDFGASTSTEPSGSSLRVMEFRVGVVDTQVIDDFSDDLSNWTNTMILDVQNPGANTSEFVISANGQLELQTTAYNGIEQYAFIYRGLSLGVGQEIVLDVLIPVLGNRNLGLYVGGTQPVAAVFGASRRQDFISVYAGQGDSVFTRGFDGTTEYALVESNAVDAQAMFIGQPRPNTFEIGYYTLACERVVFETRTPAFPNSATFVGIYADAREAGTVGTADNFRIQSVTSSVLLGDVNFDGAVNFLDISPFIAVLSGGGFQTEADIDQSGAVNFLDITPFIAILSGQ